MITSDELGGLPPDPPTEVDPADLVEQLTALDDDEPSSGDAEAPLEANEADVAEQQFDVPGAADEYRPE